MFQLAIAIREEIKYSTSDKLDAFKKFLEYISEKRELFVSMYEDDGINDVFTLDKNVYDAIVGFCDGKETSNLIFLSQSALDKASEENKIRICKNTVTIILNDDTERTLYINTNNDITTACNAMKALYKVLLNECNIDPIAFIVHMTDPEMHYFKNGKRLLTKLRNAADDRFYNGFVLSSSRIRNGSDDNSTEANSDSFNEIEIIDPYIRCYQISVEDILKDNLHIPEYQRAYVWGKKHFEALIKSLEDGISLGTIVLNKEYENRYSIVDGQQRITTLRGFLHALGACTSETDDNALIASEFLSEHLKEQQSGIDVDKIKKAVFNVLVIENAPTAFQYKVFGAINGCGKPLTLEEMVKNYLYGIIDKQSKQTSGSSKMAKLKENADTIINADFIKAYTEMRKAEHIAEDSLYDEFKEQIKNVDDIKDACPYSKLFGALKGHNRGWKSILHIKDDASQVDKELMLWIRMYRLLEVNTADALLLYVFQKDKDDKKKQIHFMRRLIMLYFLLYVDDPNGNAKKSINSKLPVIIKDYSSDPAEAFKGENLWEHLIIDLVIKDAKSKPEYIFEKLCAFDLADRTSKKIARFILLLCELWCGLSVDDAIKELESGKPSEIEHIFPANPDEKYSELLEEAKIEPPTYLFKLENVCLLEQNINKKVGNKMLKNNTSKSIKGKLEDKDKEVYKNSAFMMPKMFYDANGKNGFDPDLVNEINDIFVYDADCAKKRIEKIENILLSPPLSEHFSFKKMLDELK